MRKVAIFLVAAVVPAFGDFSYEQTSKITGGMMAGMMQFAGALSKQAREPNVTTVAVKGNRMLHGSQHHASIIDLDKETITNINYDRKTYSVMTFAQMGQMMDQMGRGTKSGDMQFKVSAKDTGQKKQIAGIETHEMILTVDMAGADPQSGSTGGTTMTTHMWMAPKVAGYDEITAFRKKMATKLNWSPGGMGAMGMRPEMMKGMAEVEKEGAKLNGMPVLETVTMGMHGEQGANGASGNLMEMTMELSGFSSGPVDGAKFDVPEGFKQTEPEMGRHRR